VINAGGALLLFFFLASLMMLVQRTERKKRMITLFFVLFGIYIVSAYGIFRMSNEPCPFMLFGRCALPQYAERARIIAYNTLNVALFSAFLFNILFWIVIGRYNPPASSDEIRVLGLSD
jgi:hypothetical protein